MALVSSSWLDLRVNDLITTISVDRYVCIHTRILIIFLTSISHIGVLYITYPIFTHACTYVFARVWEQQVNKIYRQYIHKYMIHIHTYIDRCQIRLISRFRTRRIKFCKVLRIYSRTYVRRYIRFILQL